MSSHWILGTTWFLREPNLFLQMVETRTDDGVVVNFADACPYYGITCSLALGLQAWVQPTYSRWLMMAVDVGADVLRLTCGMLVRVQCKNLKLSVIAVADATIDEPSHTTPSHPGWHGCVHRHQCGFNY